MTAQRASPASLRALQTAIQEAGDEQIVRIVDLVDTLDRQDAETILAPIRSRLRVLQLDRPLNLTRLLGMSFEAALVEGRRWRPSVAGIPRSALEPFCQVVAQHAPALVSQVQAMIAGATARDIARVHAAAKLFWPGAAAVLQDAQDVPDTWQKAGLPPASFPDLAKAAATCLSTGLRLEMLGDPTVARADVETNLAAMLRKALAAGPAAWSILAVLIFTALPDAQTPRDAVLSQSAPELKGAVDAALQQIWAWIEAGGTSAPRNLVHASAALRQRGAVLNALATHRGERPRAAAQQADLRAAYLLYASEAAQERLVAPLSSLSTGLNDQAMAGMEDNARGLRRLLIEIRNLGGPPIAAAFLQDAARAARDCVGLQPIDRARLIECLGFPQAAAKVLQA